MILNELPQVDCAFTEGELNNWYCKVVSWHHFRLARWEAEDSGALHDQGPHAHTFLQGWSSPTSPQRPQSSLAKNCLSPSLTLVQRLRIVRKLIKSELSRAGFERLWGENDILGHELIHNDAALALAAFTKNENRSDFVKMTEVWGLCWPCSMLKRYFSLQRTWQDKCSFTFNRTCFWEPTPVNMLRYLLNCERSCWKATRTDKQKPENWRLPRGSGMRFGGQIFPKALR